MDRGHPPRFGTSLTPSLDDPRRLREPKRRHDRDGVFRGSVVLH